MMKITLIAIIATLGLSLDLVSGHGMLFDPVNRASRWRYDSSAPPDYDDNQSFCGGFDVQYGINGGRCGLCGDDVRDPTPRNHENGGYYGQGVIVKNYASGSVIRVQVKITANHRGHFRFTLCNIDEQRESEECFNKHQLQVQGGGHEYWLTQFYNGMYDVDLVLPHGMRCNHCVLRWVYVASNNWGICNDGSGALGCGPQEEFRSCADVSVH